MADEMSEAGSRAGCAVLALMEVHEDALGRLCVWTLASAQHGVWPLQKGLL